jgi:hypothetical protein
MTVSQKSLTFSGEKYIRKYILNLNWAILNTIFKDKPF